MRGLVVFMALFAIIFSSLADRTASTASAQAIPAGTLLWGYEANFSLSKINLYDINTPASPITASCVPPGSINGRGIAFDPTDGNLWYSFLIDASFAGDNMIHKTTPPTPSNTVCGAVGAITVTGQQTGQNDFGALDMDPDDSSFIWVAGYKPLANNFGVAGDCQDAFCSYYYKVKTTGVSAGVVFQTCKTVFKPGVGNGIGNDSLTVAKISGLGSGKVLLTDAGEVATAPPGTFGDLLAVDVTSCLTVSHMDKVVGMNGIDYELVSLFATDGLELYQLTGANFSTIHPLGPTAAVFELEDITLGPVPTLVQQCVGKTTGGGTTSDGKANFGFNAKSDANGNCAPGTGRGQLEFNDHASGDNVHGKVDTVSFTPDPTAQKQGGKATFSGTCTVKNKTTQTSGACANGGRFTVVVEDKNEPGKGVDTFTITYNGITRGGTIRQGNIQVKIVG